MGTAFRGTRAGQFDSINLPSKGETRRSLPGDARRACAAINAVRNSTPRADAASSIARVTARGTECVGPAAARGYRIASRAAGFARARARPAAAELRADGIAVAHRA